jgi:hypothetical protein
LGAPDSEEELLLLLYSFFGKSNNDFWLSFGLPTGGSNSFANSCILPNIKK